MKPPSLWSTNSDGLDARQRSRLEKPWLSSQDAPFGPQTETCRSLHANPLPPAISLPHSTQELQTVGKLMFGSGEEVGNAKRCQVIRDGVFLFCLLRPWNAADSQVRVFRLPVKSQPSLWILQISLQSMSLQRLSDQSKRLRHRREKDECGESTNYNKTNLINKYWSTKFSQGKKTASAGVSFVIHSQTQISKLQKPASHYAIRQTNARAWPWINRRCWRSSGWAFNARVSHLGVGIEMRVCL